MRRLLTIFLFLQFFCACNNDNTETPTSENDVDAARNFIQAALDGNYKKARTFILADSLNNQYLDAVERNYQLRMSPADKSGYRNATPRILSVRPISDSVSIINYTNSYKKVNDSLKVVKANGQWMVDLKYSFASPTSSK